MSTKSKYTSSNIKSTLHITHTPLERTSSLEPLEIIIIVDRSGSMHNIKNDMIGAINSVIEDQKKYSLSNINNNARFTLVLFSDRYEIILDSVPMKDVNFITEDQYLTRGSTALYETLVKIIIRYEKKTNVVMVIVTDGKDNTSSPMYTQDISSFYIEDRKKLNWKFIYLSSDVATVSQGHSMGFQTSDSSLVRCTSNNVFANYNLLPYALHRSCSDTIIGLRDTGNMAGMGVDCKMPLKRSTNMREDNEENDMFNLCKPIDIRYTKANNDPSDIYNNSLYDKKDNEMFSPLLNIYETLSDTVDVHIPTHPFSSKPDTL
jgi:hypothetical protein